jgi:membrane-bound lytic murein transglycosylase D
VDQGTQTPPLRLRAEPGGPVTLDETFTGPFRLGRGPECEAHVPSSHVSRVHAEAAPHDGVWWVRDLDSTNGLFLNGERIQQSQLEDGDRLQLGKGGPILAVGLAGSTQDFRGARSADSAPPVTGPIPGVPPTVQTPGPSPTPTPQPSSFAPPSHGGATADGDLSLSEIEEKYLNPHSAQPAGQRTQMIRVAFDRISKKQRRKSSVVLGAVLILLAGSMAYALYQRHRVSVLDARAAEVFQTMKSYEVQLVGLRQLAEESESPGLEEQLTRIDSLRQEVMADYDGYVRERGLYRKLGSTEERLIFQTARLFGESEFAVSGSFVEAVLEEIEGYWLSSGGRTRYQEAVQRARENGYTGPIVDALRRQGVTPEFFYLALQESDFKPDAVGPETRWGRAKGMWQFIPTTAERYGLDPGPLAETAQRDPGDQREDFALASNAAARYLRDLHGVLTQASGLLVMAAYNWGEHRVAPRLESLPTPRDVFQAEFAEVPTNPEERNYWTFLTEYGDRMPDQTKDYVIKIFSAAVIGQDPRHFGFDFDNPLEAYTN